MNNKPTISIIIPTHNSEQYISRIEDCLFAQSFSDFEAVFIVSGDDRSGEMLEDAAGKDSRIRIIKDDNSSYGHKINVGIAAAQGEYISIWESDDEYDPEFLSELNAAMEPEVDFVKGSFAMFIGDSQGRKTMPCSLVGDADANRIIDLKQEPQFKANLYTHIWTGLYRTSFLRDNNIICNETPGASFQDTGFSVLCALHGQKIKFAPKATYLYRMDNVKSSSKDDTKYLCIKEEFDWIAAQMRARGFSDKESEEYFNQCRNTSYLWNAKRIHEIPRAKFLEAVQQEFQPEGLEEILATREKEHRLIEFLCGEENCILWGAAGLGRDILYLQKFIGKHAIIKVVDNNPNLLGTTVAGYTVDKPDDFANYEGNFIIAGRNCANIIKQELIEKGVDEARIVTIKQPVNREDFMLYTPLKVMKK